MRTLILLLIPFLSFSQLPTTGSLSLKSAAGAGRSISQQVDGNETGSKSLSTLSTTAGFTAPHSMLEFRGYPSGTGVPDPIVSCDAVSDGANGMDLSWVWPATGSTPNQVEIQYKADGDPGYSPLTFIAYSNTTYTHQAASLTNGVLYYYAFFSRNGDGPANSPCITSEVYTAPEPPGNITNLSSSMSCAGGIDLTWTNNAATPTADYTRIDVQVGGNPNPYTFYANVNYPGASLNIPAAELTNNVTYRYQLTPYNGGGSGLTSLTDFISFCPIPSPPLSVTATKNGSNIDVSWGIGSNADTYRLEVKANSGSYSFLEETTLRSHTFLQALPGSQYTFRVRSQNSYGNSSYTISNTVTF